MEFTKYLEQNAKKLDKEEGRILNNWFKETIKIDKHLIPLAKALMDACLGGKRIRGVLVRLGYELAGGKKEEILKVGVAFEIFHTALLIHDDIIDKSPQRRGKSSLYKSAGIPQAITLADLAFMLAVKIIAETDFESNTKNKALAFFSKTMINTTIGQMLDIQKGDPAKVMLFKTAKYTVAGPLQIGAILAGADENLFGLLGVFGEKLGIAFQIQDDILDGEETSLGREDAISYVQKSQLMVSKITTHPELAAILHQMGEFLIKRNK